ncbi:MAG: PEP-CTERM sorting domain-containing protein [Desulfobacula sp.]|uniref:PEP-CTERM sorting domain-containing protein n=1 Tax=Desulfobacula sp. TaxID=2593537 RepID=UPI0025BD2279|nr:PEP-CTERM sorting domain-containing protein [Desulfobacula sp.]MCD4720467.1 PEP-CTERM sorting domain-containing protein [Desulfobacula sp.]
MKNFLLTVLSICMVLGLFSVASATVLDFDDITTNQYAQFYSYGGLDWTHSGAVVEGYAGGYYAQSAVSGDYAFYNGDGNTATVSISSGTFDFSGAWFTPAGKTIFGEVGVEAFFGGVSQGIVNIDLVELAPLWVDFDFVGIDMLVFTPVPSTGHGSYFAMDDFTYSSNPVPEPATMLLFGLGILGIAGVNRRKK